MIFIFSAIAGIAALFVGLWLGMRRARIGVWISLAVAALSFALYAACLHYARSPNGTWALHNIGETIASGTILGLYAAAGLSGPAFLKARSWAIGVSALAIVATLTIGTVVLLLLACAFAGDCI